MTMEELHGCEALPTEARPSAPRLHLRHGTEQRDMLHNRQTKPVQGAQFLGVVGKHPDIPDTKTAENLGTDSVKAQVQPEVRLQAGFLLRGTAGVSPDFVCEARAMPFLAQIDQDPSAGFLYPAEGLPQCFAALAPEPLEDIPQRRLRLNPHEHGSVGIHLTLHEGKMVLAIKSIFENVQTEIAEMRRKFSLADLLHESVGAQPEGNQVRHRYYLQSMFPGE